MATLSSILPRTEEPGGDVSRVCLAGTWSSEAVDK